ncbi:MAG: hypothetical protein HOP02_07615 [Methylococcaceae bacterium]|nr:hypothetical protein [Methylococcaceae bacterium]
MAILLFSLRNVPEDEATEIRELLDQHAIPCYETSAGNWGISMPALWLKDDEHLALAGQLLAAYHQQRFITQRQAYLQKQQAGEAPTFIGNLLKHPLRFIAYAVCALFILAISTRLISALAHISLVK